MCACVFRVWHPVTHPCPLCCVCMLVLALHPHYAPSSWCPARVDLYRVVTALIGANPCTHAHACVRMLLRHQFCMDCSLHFPHAILRLVLCANCFTCIMTDCTKNKLWSPKTSHSLPYLFASLLKLSTTGYGTVMSARDSSA